MIRLDSSITDVHAKGGCYLCGNPNNLVDTEVDIPYEGILALCRGCIKDIALCMGFDVERSADEWDRLSAQNEENRYVAESSLKALAEIHETTKRASHNHKSRLRQKANRAEEQQ